MPDTPPTPTIPDFGPGALDRAIELVHYLRRHCPWDAQQTPHSLIPHLLQETHEVVDAIRDGDPTAQEEELGDLLFNLAFQIAIAEEGDDMDRHSVVRHLQDKMVRRHPHLFGLGEERSWEELKAQERAKAPSTRAHPEGTSALNGIPTGLDPLLRAHRLQHLAAGVGFDWSDVSGAWDKVEEELHEVKEALHGDDAEHLAEELGDLMFAVVNVVRLAQQHPDPILDHANRKFERRFRAMEELALERNVVLGEASLEKLEVLWEEVKRRD